MHARHPLAAAQEVGSASPLPKRLPASEEQLDSYTRARTPGRRADGAAGAGGTAQTGSLASVRLPGAAHSSLPTILALIAAVLLVGAVSFDSLGYGPRHREWRRRWSPRRLLRR